MRPSYQQETEEQRDNKRNASFCFWENQPLYEQEQSARHSGRVLWFPESHHYHADKPEKRRCGAQDPFGRIVCVKPWP